MANWQCGLVTFLHIETCGSVISIILGSLAIKIIFLPGTRKTLEDQLAASKIFSAAFAEAAARKEEAIKAHIGTVHIEEVCHACHMYTVFWLWRDQQDLLCLESPSTYTLKFWLPLNFLICIWLLLSSHLGRLYAHNSLKQGVAIKAIDCSQPDEKHMQIALIFFCHKSHTVGSWWFIHFRQESLKARQREVNDAEAAITTAVEAQGRAESKLVAAKSEYEKALARAKAAGIPDLPTAPAEDGKGWEFAATKVANSVGCINSNLNYLIGLLFV